MFTSTSTPEERTVALKAEKIQDGTLPCSRSTNQKTKNLNEFHNVIQAYNYAIHILVFEAMGDRYSFLGAYVRGGGGAMLTFTLSC